VALGNAGSAEAVPALAEALVHEDSTVRGHAAWALGRIGGAGAREALLAARGREADAGILDEIELALAATAPTGSPHGRTRP
jgi:epoxyqueuosine reductase